MKPKEPKVVITDYFFPEVDIEKELLESAGAYVIERQIRDEDGVIKECEDAVGIITQFAPFTRRVLKSLKHCKVIARYGVGYDNVDVEAATELGILVANVPEYCTEEVALHTVALMLTMARKVMVYDRFIRSGGWGYAVGRPIPRLSNTQLGLIGFGRMGRAVARYCAGLGMRVSFYDPYVRDSSEIAEKVDNLAILLNRSDFISLHIPLTKDTYHLIGEEELKSMKQTAVLINTSRGPIIDEAALVRALKEGWIGGAALDVFEKEPLPEDHELRKLENVVCTPHAAWYSQASEEELHRTVAEEVIRVLKGELPRNLVNPEAVKRPR